MRHQLLVLTVALFGMFLVLDCNTVNARKVKILEYECDYFAFICAYCTPIIVRSKEVEKWNHGVTVEVKEASNVIVKVYAISNTGERIFKENILNNGKAILGMPWKQHPFTVEIEVMCTNCYFGCPVKAKVTAICDEHGL